MKKAERNDGPVVHDVDLLEKECGPGCGIFSWPYGGKVAEDMLANLEAIRCRWHQNRLGGKSVAYIYRWCVGRYKLSVGATTFSKWFRRNPDGEEEN